MATKPVKTVSLDKMKSIDIINAVNNDLGGTYSDQVPMVMKMGDVTESGFTVTGQEAIMSLRAVGSAIMSSQILQNAFLSQLVNRIGKVVITSRLYENPWTGFKKGFLEYGETIEEIFVNIAKPFQFNPDKAENEVFKRRIPDVRSAFHSMNYQKFYPTTVSENELRQAFLSWDGVTDLIGRVIEQVYTGANYDEFLVMKYLIAQVALRGGIYPVNIPVATNNNAREITRTMVKYAKDISYMSNTFNEANVTTYTDPKFLYMILTTDISSLFDVEVLALSFNMNKAELIGRQVGVDGFGTFDNARLIEIFEDDPFTQFEPFTTQELLLLSSIQGLMVDEKWFMIYDNLYNMTEIYNPQGLYWNHFYHVWKTLSISPFSNAIMFTTSTDSVTSISVSPKTASVEKGSTLQLTENVVATGFANKDVTWEITTVGSTSTISSTGLLTVNMDDESATLTIKVTSVFNESKTDSATITIA